MLQHSLAHGECCHAQVVLVSSMGICDAENRLNKIGDGNILIWKRRAEKYLIGKGFQSFTIIHPGGLLDLPVRLAPGLLLRVLLRLLAAPSETICHKQLSALLQGVLHAI